MQDCLRVSKHLYRSEFQVLLLSLFYKGLKDAVQEGVLWPLQVCYVTEAILSCHGAQEKATQAKPRAADRHHLPRLSLRNP